jgi:hypothetical protein
MRFRVCYNCPRRCRACHDTCPDYAKEVEQNEVEKAARVAYHDAERAIRASRSRRVMSVIKKRHH